MRMDGRVKKGIAHRHLFEGNTLRRGAICPLSLLRFHRLLLEHCGQPQIGRRVCNAQAGGELRRQPFEPDGLVPQPDVGQEGCASSSSVGALSGTSGTARSKASLAPGLGASCAPASDCNCK